MNKRQKLVQQQFLNDEEAVIKRLNKVYTQSLSDVSAKVNELSFKIGELQKRYDWLDVNDPEREKVKSMIQSKIYQKQYQEQLHKQLGGIVDKIKTKQFTTVSAYLDECYTNGAIGAMFDLHGQGIPLIMPIDQKAMVRAVQLDSKISKGLYTRLGEDVDLLKRKIVAQVSRGIATGQSYAQVAKGLSDYTRIGFNNAVRIARTEGHRIQNTAAMDTMHAAKEKGADIVKQWDSTLDSSTRESHAKVDGEIRELDEPFSNGLQFAGDPNGGAAEVVNCRCATLQRARAALDDGFTKMNNFTKELETFESPQKYDEFKEAFFSKENKQFMNYSEELYKRYKTKDIRKLLESMSDREYAHYSQLLAKNPIFNKNSKNHLTNNVNSDKIPVKIVDGNIENENIRKMLEANNVEFRAVEPLKKELSESEIIERLGGGDMTKGSCSSLAFAYTGNKAGFDVLDFRGGGSCYVFSSNLTINEIASLKGVNGVVVKDFNDFTVANKLLKMVEDGKEYYFGVGQHVAIIRKAENGFEFLELQSRNDNGFKPLTTDILKRRFACKKSHTVYGTKLQGVGQLMECTALAQNSDFKKILGYINTAGSEQRKGIYGTIK